MDTSTHPEELAADAPGQEEAQQTGFWARARMLLAQPVPGFRRKGGPEREVDPAPVEDKAPVEEKPPGRLTRKSRALLVGAVSLTTAYWGTIVVALATSPFNLDQGSQRVTVVAAGVATLAVTSSWLATAPSIKRILDRTGWLLLAELGVLGILATAVGSRELFEIFS